MLSIGHCSVTIKTGTERCCKIAQIRIFLRQTELSPWIHHRMKKQFCLVAHQCSPAYWNTCACAHSTAWISGLCLPFQRTETKREVPISILSPWMYIGKLPTPHCWTGYQGLRRESIWDKEAAWLIVLHSSRNNRVSDLVVKYTYSLLL